MKAVRNEGAQSSNSLPIHFTQDLSASMESRSVGSSAKRLTCCPTCGCSVQLRVEKKLASSTHTLLGSIISEQAALGWDNGHEQLGDSMHLGEIADPQGCDQLNGQSNVEPEAAGNQEISLPIAGSPSTSDNRVPSRAGLHRTSSRCASGSR